MKVWIVEAGCYSDRRIIGVFTNEAEAKNIELSLDASVSEWDTDKGLEGARKGLPWYVVAIDRQGVVDDVLRGDIDYDDPPEENTHRFQEEIINGKWVNHMMVVHCYAKDEAHAIKIASELLTMTLARGDWDRID
jgi:hypothetical protein